MHEHKDLFPDAQARSEKFRELDILLDVARTSVIEGSVSPTLDFARFQADLTSFDFGSVRDWSAVSTWVVNALAQGGVQMVHPRYLGLFNPAPCFLAEAADRISAAYNHQLAVRSHAPVAVDIEAHTIRAVGRKLGYGENAGGHFTSGGAEANFTSLICALTAACVAYGDEGLSAFAQTPVIYASRESHLAWLKIAHQAGIGRASVRLVETDGRGQLSTEALRAAIGADIAAGKRPALVVATAGTTNAGMIDPLKATAEIARQCGAWYHVDAAWGGALCASDALGGALQGIEQADSVTIDAHKWLAGTMGAGMFITRRPETTREAFRVAASYMPSADAAVDPYISSVQWSRRFLGLRLFLTLAACGWAGLSAHVERGVRLAGALRDNLDSRGWTIENDSLMAVVCATPPRGRRAPAQIAESVAASGEAWVSVAVFEGRPVVRACITNGMTTERDVASIAELLDAASHG